jgi:exodeoxyribonuclease V beta subunit
MSDELTRDNQTQDSDALTDTVASRLLDVPSMPLHGRHLIEASAGTGKTYNITRLYLRLLLEKKLTVKEVLVMTFTKAATEEIKGRVAATLREAASFWQQVLDNNGAVPEGIEPKDVDPVFSHLLTHCNLEESLSILRAAQLELDEASVFTIHGFCQHVIGQLAFNSGFAMSLNLSKDTSELYLQASEDWIRKVSGGHDGYTEDDFLLLASKGWHVPERLLGEFNASIRSTLTPKLLDENAVNESFMHNLESNPNTQSAQFMVFLHDLEANESLLYEQLIKTPAHKKVRPGELEALKLWLKQGQYTDAPSEAKAFLDKRRYSRNSSGVKELLSPIKDFTKAIETEIEERDNTLAQLPVFALVNDAISFIKDRVIKQKKQRGIIDFDDLINMLADEVAKPDNTLVAELRKKFPVALIDEFQDTDAKQYAILDAVYPRNSNSNALATNSADSHTADFNAITTATDTSETASYASINTKTTALLMIGDPKQAIYRFRGGDIFTYLKAGKQADFRWVMNTNWRSVKGMVSAYNRVFYGAPLSAAHSGNVFGFNIDYTQVEFTKKAAAAKHPLTDPCEQRSAMNYVSMCLDDKQDTNTMRRKMALWIAQEIYRLLNEAGFDNSNPESEAVAPVTPADIAILVKDRTEANVIKYVLQQQGLACVYLSDRSNLFLTPEAKDILRLLNGIWHAGDSSKVAASLASPLWGYSPQVLVDLLYHEDDALWDIAYERVLLLREMWLQKGCMSVLLYLMQESYTPYGGEVERALTNYQHLAEVLQKASTTHQRPEQLLDWLHKQIHQPESDEEMTLRLESDNQLIRLVTQHGSKGLEYPIVFIPFATGYKDPAKNGKSMSQILTYFDEDKQGLQLQLGQTKQAIARVRAEGAAEDMRLAYVAVTRAAHRCYMGVIPLDGNEKSALARALGVSTDSANDWHSVLDNVSGEADAYTCHISADEFDIKYTSFTLDETSQGLYALQFTGTHNEDWRLYSFSALSRLTMQGNIPVASQKEHTVPVLQTVRDEEFSIDALASLGDKFANETADKPITTNIEDAQRLRFTLTKGASAGNLLHDLLELNDFSNPTWDEHGPELVSRFGLDEDKVSSLYDWLEEVLQTPLYPNISLTLSDLTLGQTLREAEFYFPMNDSKWARLSEVLREHRAKVAGEYNAQALTVPHLITANLAGMMHGFIDLLFEYEGKYYVADYKSTWLGDDIASYSPNALFENNQHHLYDLQYLIYCLALHRYLNNTLADYQPERHFGGVYYLYLRGMHPENLEGEGVFFTPISQEILHSLDGIFDGDDLAKAQTDKNSRPTSEKKPDERSEDKPEKMESGEAGHQQSFGFD